MAQLNTDLCAPFLVGRSIERNQHHSMIRKSWRLLQSSVFEVQNGPHHLPIPAMEVFARLATYLQLSSALNFYIYGKVM
jgi:hypothetical protein